MKEYTFRVTLTLKGPIITAATEAGSLGMDKPFARNTLNQLYLPGTQIKGRLKEAIEYCLLPYLPITKVDFNRWFGNESQERDVPKRGKLLFSDFLTDQRTQGAIRNRIEIDPARGAVKKGSYMVIEAPFDTEDEVKFAGTIRFVGNDVESELIKKILTKTFRWIPALGGQKTVGFGRMIGVHIDDSSPGVEIPQPKYSQESCETLHLNLKPLSPFCVAKPIIGNNLFESDTVISGGVIKGCLANTLNLIGGRDLDEEIKDLPDPWTELGECFSSLRLTHAFPSREGQESRPRRYPLSIVRAKKNTYDVALCPGPGLIDGTAPAFSIDWKGEDYDEVDTEFNWKGEMPRTLRVRTAIEFETRRAEEGNLFAYDMIIPDEFVWHFQVCLSKVPPDKKAKVRSQLETLFGFGLRLLSKTKTQARITSSVAGKDFNLNPIDGKVWIITLQTPALMVNPWDTTFPFNQGLRDQSILKNVYNQYWKNISNPKEPSMPKLELVRFFAQQKLLGRYLHHRFQAKKPYNPFLVTTEGSVFVLKIKDGSSTEDIKPLLKTWLDQGLPLPEWAITEYGNSWETNPFIPENGFGEIAVNLDCHTDKQPKDKYEEVKNVPS